jgi:hypothetical protein
MRALGLHELIPASLSAGRQIVVLVCYLDDSGNDPQNRIITVAGYIAKDKDWEDFEIAVERWFEEFGVSILHATELHNTRGDFEGWTILRKQAFVARICQEMTPRISLGVSMSAVKGTYKIRAEESDRKRTLTPYTFCFGVIIDWFLRSVSLGRQLHRDGVAFILESGNEHNPEAELNFHDVRQRHKLQNVLRSICFVNKDSCRAIQVADLLAFYSRRHGVAMEKAPLTEQSQVSSEAMMNLIGQSVPHQAFVATDFGPQVQPSFVRPLS